MPTKKEDYWIRPKRDLLKYQVKFFEKELKAEQKALDHLIETREERAKTWKPKFTSHEEMKEAYAKGVQGDIDWNWQRRAVWQVYSDRGHLDRIKWLTEEYEKYKALQDLFNEYLEDRRKDAKRRDKQRRRMHNKRGPYRQTIEKMETEKRKKVEEKKARKRAEQKKVYKKKEWARTKQLRAREEKYKELFK